MTLAKDYPALMIDGRDVALAKAEDHREDSASLLQRAVRFRLAGLPNGERLALKEWARKPRGPLVYSWRAA